MPGAGHNFVRIVITGRIGRRERVPREFPARPSRAPQTPASVTFRSVAVCRPGRPGRAPAFSRARRLSSGELFETFPGIRVRARSPDLTRPDSPRVALRLIDLHRRAALVDRSKDHGADFARVSLNN